MAKNDDCYLKQIPHGPYGSNSRPSLGAGDGPDAAYLEGTLH